MYSNIIICFRQVEQSPVMNVDCSLSLFLFLQGQCTLIKVSVKVTVLASRLFFNRSSWAGYLKQLQYRQSRNSEHTQSDIEQATHSTQKATKQNKQCFHVSPATDNMESGNTQLGIIFNSLIGLQPCLHDILEVVQLWWYSCV